MGKRYMKIPYEMMSKGLSSTAILLYGILLALAFQDEAYCTNKYLAKELNISVRTVQNLLTELVKANTISIREDKNNRYIKPLIICEIIAPKNSKDKVFEDLMDMELPGVEIL